MSLDAMKAQTQQVYERQAKHWLSLRHPIIHKQDRVYLDRFLDKLPKGGRVLDLGCGSGKPVTDYVLRRGLKTVGLDYASAMIDLAQTLYPKSVYPNADWVVGDMRELPDLGRFHGIYSWDGFFHLSQDEQRRALPDILARLLPGGEFLMTVGPAAGETSGYIGDAAVYHASLAHEEYAQILRCAGCVGVKCVTLTEAGRTLLLGSKSA